MLLKLGACLHRLTIFSVQSLQFRNVLSGNKEVCENTYFNHDISVLLSLFSLFP